ncbi:MAG: hypothetical protein GY744_11820 [Gammaproteobacteria bacterium]|nr:hypothetical protein [Gammaproteobacteria bacterium]
MVNYGCCLTISESGIAPEYWDYLKVIEDSHLDAEVFEAAVKLDINYDMVEEQYQGQYESDKDFAYLLADEMGLAPEGNDWPASYIDWDRAACDLMMDYGESDGYYFRSSY